MGFAIALTVATSVVLTGFRRIEQAWLKRHPRRHPAARPPETFDRG